MAVVLPMAGVQQYFCTIAMVFMDCAENCPVDKQNDCCSKEKQPESPACTTVAKVLPNASITIPAQIPVIGADRYFLEGLVFGAVADDQFEAVIPLRHRGPPDLRRMYMVQRRLLI
jgi:hypothetical protein